MKRESGVEFTVNCGSKVPQDDERKDGSSSGISEADQLSEYDDDSSDDNESVLEEDGAEPSRAATSKQRTQFPFHRTKNKKREHGEDIKQGSSLAVVLNQSEKN